MDQPYVRDVQGAAVLAFKKESGPEHAFMFSYSVPVHEGDH